MSRRVVTLGETMAALSSHTAGPLRNAPAMSLSAAGSESTVAVGLARLGHDAAWVGRVGADELGELVLTRLRGAGVALRHRVDGTAPTGLMLREQRAAGVHRVHYYRSGSAGSRLTPGDLPADLLAAGPVLHTSGITTALSPSAREAVRQAMLLTREAGGLVSFDVNHRARLWTDGQAREVLTGLLPRIDVLFASEDEVAVLLPGDRAGGDLVEDAGRLRALGPATVVVTRGAAGSLSVSEHGVHHAAAPVVQEVDPVGAGDSFVAGYLSALLDGEDEAGRLERGTRVAALSVMTRGDWEGLPHRGELGLVGLPSGTVAR